VWTFREEFVFRGKVTRGVVRGPGQRSSCTRWRTCGSATWSRCCGGTTLWLERSPSADFMGAFADGGRPRSTPTGWITFANRRKAWGVPGRTNCRPRTTVGWPTSATSRTPSSTSTGITYSKGASVLQATGRVRGPGTRFLEAAGGGTSSGNAYGKHHARRPAVGARGRTSGRDMGGLGRGRGWRRRRSSTR